MDEKIWRTIRDSMQSQAGDDNPSRVARNVVYALSNAGYSIIPTVSGGLDYGFPLPRLAERLRQQPSTEGKEYRNPRPVGLDQGYRNPRLSEIDAGRKNDASLDMRLTKEIHTESGQVLRVGDVGIWTGRNSADNEMFACRMLGGEGSGSEFWLDREHFEWTP